MTNSELLLTLSRAGIDPAKTFIRHPDGGIGALAIGPQPGLRPPTFREIEALRSCGIPAINNSVLMLPRVGATDPNFATVFPGWNVWAVWQVKDLDFHLGNVGLSRDTQLRIWVEDHVRLEAPEAKVADPIDFKGSQIQILQGEPTGLKEAQRKEQVPGDAMLLESQDQEPELRFVRFFNRGLESRLPWPHDDNYLLDRIYQPDPQNDATKGPGPGTITDRNVINPAAEAGKTAVETILVAGLVGLLGFAAYTVVQQHRSSR